MAQPMHDACPIACVGFGARKPKRIYLPQHRMFDPAWHLFSLGAMGDNALPRHHPRMRVNQYCRVPGISYREEITGYSAFAEYDGSLWSNACPLETKIGHGVSALVLDHVGTARALKRFLGVLIAERRGFFVIGFRGVRILRTAAPALGERAHPLQRAGVILRGRLFKQRPRGSIIRRAAGAVFHHQSQLILGFGIGLRRFRQQLPRSRWISRRPPTTGHPRAISDAPPISLFPTT